MFSQSNSKPFLDKLPDCVTIKRQDIISRLPLNIQCIHYIKKNVEVKLYPYITKYKSLIPLSFNLKPNCIFHQLVILHNDIRHSIVKIVNILKM